MYMYLNFHTKLQIRVEVVAMTVADDCYIFNVMCRSKFFTWPGLSHSNSHTLYLTDVGGDYSNDLDQAKKQVK